MKFLIVFITSLLINTSTYAIDSEIKITTFKYSTADSKLAELCGYVSYPTSGLTYIQIIVDEDSDQPGYYNSFAGYDGHFCMTLTTYLGTARARFL